MNKTIELKDIGPVERIAIAVPEEGGIVVLKARNGAGKSSTLQAVESALTGRGSLSVRDGALRGEVQAFGAKISVGRSTRRTGELEVTSLEGRLSVAELVDPGLKSPDAADARRIKALVQITGETPDVRRFYRLLGTREEFERYASTAAINSEDYVAMADRLKRDLEAAARKGEEHVANLENRARGVVESCPEVPEDAESDEGILQSQLEAAIVGLTGLRQIDLAAHEAMETRSRHKSQLESLRAKAVPTDYADKLAKLQAAETILVRDRENVEYEASVVRSKINELESDLNALQLKGKALIEEQNRLKHEQESIREQVDQENGLREQIQLLESALDAETPQPVEMSVLAAAELRVQAARKAVETGALVRHAMAKKQEADAFLSEAGKCRKQSDILRVAAKETDSVLSEVVAQSCELLRVESGRLVLDTHRGATYFAELSAGQRWKIAIDIALTQLDASGVIVLPQESYEGLDPIARQEIAEHARLRKVVILTAEASADESIVCEVLAPEVPAMTQPA